MWQVAEEFAVPVRELLDFSANINPRGLPPRARERLMHDASNARLLSFYPDPSARGLRNILSQRLQVPAEAIVIGPGAESLLSPILRCLQPRRALVPVPAFSEYRRVCEQQNIQFAPFPLNRSELFRTPVDSVQAAQNDVVFLNNPHNPTGALLEAHEVRRIRERVNHGGANVLLDEAFIDYAPHASLAQDAAARPGLVVLRSLTKFYGCPALRVGYAIAHPNSIQRIVSLLPTWSVTQLALDALTEALLDRDFEAVSLSENSEARAVLAESLSTLGMIVFPSAANYLFVELAPGMPQASKLRVALIVNHRILIRNCDSYAGLTPGRYVRVAVRSTEENRHLVEAMAAQLS